jgi:hypothetical protein
MSEFSNDVRQRRLLKGGENVRFTRTISIELETITGIEVHVRIEDHQITGKNHGLLEPQQKTVSNFSGTQRLVPCDTLEKAIEFAEQEFKRSVEHEHFEALPVGAHYPF